MRLNENVQVPTEVTGQLRAWLYDQMRAIATKVNAMAYGRLAAVDGTATAAPTTGSWARGDTLTNSTPSEAGGAGAKYVIVGWKCVTSGAPGTWLEMRTLTGN
jgi:orotidine-5'-phosphate decarboxylase